MPQPHPRTPKPPLRTGVAGLTAAAATLLTGTASAQDAAAADAGGQISFFEMFLWSDDLLGLLIIWLLVLLSVISLTLTVRFLLGYRKADVNPDATREQLTELLGQKKFREAVTAAGEDTTHLGRITASALQEAAGGYPAMARALEERADAEVARMVRPVELLNVLGNIAPMIGLLGTVYGMIRAFQALVEAGGQPDPVVLAAGISTALVTTLWGLLVAIPALAGYALIRNRLDALTAEALISAEAIIKPFKPVPQRRGVGAAATPRPNKAAETKSDIKPEIKLDTKPDSKPADPPAATP